MCLHTYAVDNFIYTVLSYSYSIRRLLVVLSNHNLYICFIHVLFCNRVYFVVCHDWFGYDKFIVHPGVNLLFIVCFRYISML